MIFWTLLIVTPLLSECKEIAKRSPNPTYRNQFSVPYHYENVNNYRDFEPNPSLSCGKRKANIFRSFVNDQTTMPGDWPWHVAIFRSQNSVNNYLCGGTLIDNRQILTTASCLIDPATGLPIDPKSLTTLLGAFDISSDTKYSRKMPVRKVFIHPFYQYPEPDNNIGIIKLTSRVFFNDYIKPACIWEDDLNLLTKNYNVNGTILTWGVSIYDQTPNILKSSILPIMGHDQCMTTHPRVDGKVLNEAMFCAGSSNDASNCNGDYGGGIFLNHYNTWYIAGIVLQSSVTHWANQECTSKDHSVLLNLAHYIDWIQDPESLDDYNDFAHNIEEKFNHQETPAIQESIYKPVFSYLQKEQPQIMRQHHPQTGSTTVLNNKPEININLHVHLTITPDKSSKDGYKVVASTVTEDGSDIKGGQFTEPTEAPTSQTATSTQRTRPTTTVPDLDKLINNFQKPFTTTDASALANLRISERKCLQYSSMGYATTDGRRTYIRLFQDGNPISDGRFISENFIIFPAHELVGSNPTHVEKTRGKTTTRYNVAEVIFHPKFVPGMLYNDLALVRLIENAEFNTGTRVFCLYSDEIIPEEYLTGDGEPLRIMSKSDCESSLPPEIRRNELPSGISQNQLCINMCQTRKLAIKNPDVDYANLVGFLSYCTAEQTGVGVYTKIAPNIDWIEGVVWSDSDIKKYATTERPITTTTRTTRAPITFTTTTESLNIFIPPGSKRVSQEKCQEYNKEGFATTDGKKTYIRLYQDGETISDGRFISERYLLFPAHEVIDTNPTHVEKTRGKTTTRYNVEGVIIHPGFVKGKLYNDFALVKLSEDAQFGPGTKVFCLKPDNNISENQIVVDGDPVRILSKSECESKLSPEFLATELSNGLSENQICLSECQTRKLAVMPTADISVSELIGFQSYCTEDKTGTGIYTKVYPYLDWIEKTVWGPQSSFTSLVVSSTTPSTPTTTAEPVFIPPPSLNGQNDFIEQKPGARISEKECQSYNNQGYATTDGKRTYIKLFDNGNSISDGRFISENFLVFPAHEVFNSTPTHVEKTRGKTTTRYNVEKVILHPNYVPGLLYNDIALVKLSEPAQFGTGTKLFCLYPDDIIDESWLVADGDPLKILSKSECEARLSPEVLKAQLPNGIQSDQLCINECQTRKLAIKNPDVQMSNLIGFLSYCTEEKSGTGVYTKLAPMLDWLESVVWPNSLSQRFNLERFARISENDNLVSRKREVNPTFSILKSVEPYYFRTVSQAAPQDPSRNQFYYYFY